MRITTGEFKNRKLAKSDHLKSLRPTTEMAREALFSILRNGKFLNDIEFLIEQNDVLDVCAGSGSVGLESISRGANSVTFIDNNRVHLELLKQNIAILGVEAKTKVFHADARKLPHNQSLFGLVFIDPPYDADAISIMKGCIDKGWIQEKSLVVLEHKYFPHDLKIEGLKLLDQRHYGRTSFSFLRLSFDS